MSATFMHDPNYVEVCGKRSILELATTLDALFDKNDVAFHASSLRLESKTFGRVVDLEVLRGEISCLQSDIAESKTTFEFFWKTALYLRGRMSAYEERLETLKKQVKEQEELRAKFEIAARGPTLPREIIDDVLGHVPLNNELIWEGKTHVYVDGLIACAVYRQSLLSPYYEDLFDSKWTLDVIADQKLRRSVLDDAALADHIKLRVKTCEDISDLCPLMNYAHLWNKLRIRPSLLVMDDFIKWYTSCFHFLEELDIHAWSVKTPTVVTPLDGRRLKTARFSFRMLSDFFNSGCLRSITSLRLYWFNPSRFANHDAFKEALHNFPYIMNQLPSLYKLAVWHMKCERNDLEGVPRIKSSLRSLDVGIYGYDSVLAAAFLSLFTECRIDSICVDASLLREAEVLFGSVQRVCVRGHDLEILFERDADGNLPFFRMELLELIFCDDMRRDEIDIPQLQDQVLQVVRARFEEPTSCKIGQFRMPRLISTNAEYQEEIERYVHSLVLTDWEFER